VRAYDIVSRQGGNVFVIFMTEERYSENAAVTAEKILAAMAASVPIGNDELHVTTSIGISVYPADGDDAETLLKNADAAMYCAKGNGRNNYQFFNQEMNVRAVERQMIEADLRHALERKELVLFYRPKIDLVTGLITGAEALLRWQHPKRGMLSPEPFVPVAEDCGLIVPIGRWVLHEACAEAKRWMDSDLSPVSVAVNISAVEFRHKGIVSGVRAILKETGLDPGCLQLALAAEGFIALLATGAESLATKNPAGGVKL
jgi:predicted signal transduction protein with EAL and GGDEF domain